MVTDGRDPVLDARLAALGITEDTDYPDDDEVEIVLLVAGDEDDDGR